MKKFLILFFIFFGKNFAQSVIYRDQPKWNNGLDLVDIENRLKNEKIIAVYDLKLFNKKSLEDKYFFEKVNNVYNY